MIISKTQPAIPDWLPDWTKPDQYPDPETASSRQWAWEFLRRNPKYQELWEEYRALTSDYIPVLRRDHPLWEIVQRFKREFGVKIVADPAMPSTDRYFVVYPGFVSQSLKYDMKPAVDWPEDEDIPVHDIEDPAEVVMHFNLRLPIDTQIAAAKQILEREANHLKGVLKIPGRRSRRRIRKYRDYLRILDATARGATDDEIAQVIYPNSMTGKRMVRDGRKAARPLRDGKYLFIVIMGEKPRWD